MPLSYRAELMRRRLLGALVLIAAVIAVAGLWKGPNPFVTRQVVRADLSDASGLAPIGADVRVAGVPVGKITGVVRAGNSARLTLSLDPGTATVHRDAGLSLHPRLMFEGTAYAELTLGSPGAPALGAGVIARSRTSTYVPLSDALSVLGTRTRADVRTVAGAGAGMLSAGAPAQLRGALSVAPELTGDGAVLARAARGPGGTELRAAVGSLSHLASAIASQSPAVGAGLGEAAHTAAALNVGADAPLTASLARLPATAADVDTGAVAASRILVGARELIPRSLPGVAQLKPTLEVIRPLLRQSVPALSAFAPVLRVGARVVTGARQGAGPALAAVRALTPTLGVLQSTLLNALERPTSLGTPAYLAFLGLFAGGGGASRPFGVDGSGHFMRFGLRFLTGIGLPLPPCTLLDKVSPILSSALQGAGGCTT